MFDLILIGFGNVARRFVRLLEELGPQLDRDHDTRTRVIGIATRSHGRAFAARGLNAVSLASRLETGDALGARRGTTLAFLRETLGRSARTASAGRLIVMELTTLDVASGRPALDHVRTALAAGAHVVTANKGPAAYAYRQLSDEARRRRRCFRFESSVMDGVPVFNLQRSALPGATVHAFRGVLNSTTNYMLTAMEHGESFGAALAAMQAAGIAEADPSLDVEGWDAAAKTAILANVLLDGDLTSHSIDREALSAAEAQRVTAARKVGRRLKLVASAERAGGEVCGRVRLTELPETDLLAQLEGPQNALVLQTDVLGEIAIVQRGSGLTGTAYGLVSDIVSIAREMKARTGRRARRQPPPAAPRGRSRSEYARRRR